MNIVSNNRTAASSSRTKRDWWTRVSGLSRAMLAVAFTGLATTACGSDSPTDADVLSTITVTPGNASVAASGTQQFTARGTDSSGDSIALSNITWTVASGGGTITSNGMYTAGTGAGPATIRASSGAISGTASITVSAAAVASITITPSSPVTVNAGLTQQFTVTGLDANGNSVTVTPVWSVTSGGGTISPTGLFTAGATAGTYTNTVVATSGGITARATVMVPTNAVTAITITPTPVSVTANGTQQFTAVARDAAGNVVNVTPTWSVASGGGTINATTGVFTAGATGGSFANTVRATFGAVSAQATVHVNTGPLATITVSSTASSVEPNGTQTFTAVGRDAGGNVFVMQNPVWSVTNGGGTINPTTGVFTAGPTAGTYTGTVRVTSGAISGTANAVVMPVLATISLIPSNVSLVVNGTQQFTAVGRDAQGNVMPITSTWSIVTGAGTINATTGMYTAGATAGTGSVRATSGTVSTVATFTVTPTAGPAPLIDLGAAAMNGISAATTITCVNGGRISGDVSLSPGSSAVNFGSGELCTSSGTVHIANPTASFGQVALGTAYTQLDGLACPTANTITGSLGGTRAPGVYCTAGAIAVSAPLTLDAGGDPNATFVFRAGTTLTGTSNIILINGAQAKNVYWQVGTTTSLGAGTTWQGNILAQGNISMANSAILFGRALSRTGSVALGSNNVVVLP